MIGTRSSIVVERGVRTGASLKRRKVAGGEARNVRVRVGRVEQGAGDGEGAIPYVGPSPLVRAPDRRWHASAAKVDRHVPATQEPADVCRRRVDGTGAGVAPFEDYHGRPRGQ